MQVYFQDFRPGTGGKLIGIVGKAIFRCLHDVAIHDIHVLKDEAGLAYCMVPGRARLHRGRIIVANGRGLYDASVTFASPSAYHAFSDAVLEAVARAHPEVRI